MSDQSEKSEDELPPEERADVEYFIRSRNLSGEGFRRAVGSRGIGRETTAAPEEAGPEMHFWKEGDQSEAICHSCDKIVTTRFEVRTVHLSESRIDVPGVLVGVCTQCDRVVVLPAQSTPKIKEARASRNSVQDAL